ncbi:DUF5791 family protein [Halorhabdus rudnickae]|uniref:DUF5791 family protein n=1 Tax=Halorhabdus rudnickae TaxID=1775544 RepID=UPI001082323F|nr:DUF5791 family protein [Halorhabdus rudnickae]
MLADVDPADHSPGSLREAYGRTLRDAIEATGVSEIAEATDLDPAIVEEVAAGENDGITLTEATAILAIVDDRTADAIAADARDRLLLGMSSAVLDVDALARRLDGDVQAKELQAKIEGRHPLTLAEYARIQAAIAGES